MMDPLMTLLLASGGGSILSSLLGGGSSGLSAEQKRLLNIQGDVAETQRDLIQSRAANESANMPQVLQTIFQAVNNQLGQKRTQVLGPNFQPRLQQRGTVAPITSKWTPYTGTKNAALTPPPDIPAASGPKVEYPSYNRGVPPVPVSALAGILGALIPGDLGQGFPRPSPGALAGAVRDTAEGAIAPGGSEALLNPYYTSGPGSWGDASVAASENLPDPVNFTPPGDFGFPSQQAGLPPGATGTVGGGSVDVSGEDIWAALQRLFASGVQRFTHLPAVRGQIEMTPEQAHNMIVTGERYTLDPTILTNEWDINTLPNVQRVPPGAVDSVLSQHPGAYVVIDPLTGQPWRNDDGTTMVAWIPQNQVSVIEGQSSDSGAIPPEVAQGLASGMYRRDQRTGNIYSATGQLIWEAPEASNQPPTVAVNDQGSEIVPVGPKKIRR